MLHDLLKALEETLFMVFSSGLLTAAIGLPLAASLTWIGPRPFKNYPYLQGFFKTVLSLTESVPFMALMVALTPLTTHLNPDLNIAVIGPLTLGALPYFIRRTQKAFLKVPKGLIEVAESAGASPWQILAKILIPGALPSLIQALTRTLVKLVSYSTLAGALGAGGLGSLMLKKGYASFEKGSVLSILLVLILLTKTLQISGNYIAEGSLLSKSQD